MTMRLGRRNSGPPIPDWLVVAFLVGLTAFLVWMVWDRIAQRRKAAAWIRDVGMQTPGLDPGGVAGVVAEHLGLDAEAFRGMTFERFEQTEQRQGNGFRGCGSTRPQSLRCSAARLRRSASAIRCGALATFGYPSRSV